MPEQWKPLTGLDELEKAAAEPSKRPQFTRAEYTQSTAAPSCQICLNTLTHEFFKLNGRSVCPDCAAKAKAGNAVDGGHAAFMQGLLFGGGAALLGLFVYAGFTIVTHFYFGYVAVAVGWLVGKAMMKGSNGVGGLRYQIAAVALTYLAISLASIPIMITEIAPAQEVDWVSKLPELALWGIFSPFIELRGGLFGIIGLVILGAGIRFAWRITAARRLVVAGPYYI